MSEEKRKTTLNPTNITLAIIAFSNIAALAFIAGRIDEGMKSITNETQKWDSEVIALNEKMLS